MMCGRSEASRPWYFFMMRRPSPVAQSASRPGLDPEIDPSITFARRWIAGSSPAMTTSDMAGSAFEPRQHFVRDTLHLAELVWRADDELKHRHADVDVALQCPCNLFGGADD